MKKNRVIQEKSKPLLLSRGCRNEDDFFFPVSKNLDKPTLLGVGRHKDFLMIIMIFLFVSILIISLIINLINATISSEPYYYNIELDNNNNKMDNKLSIKSVNIEFHYEAPLNFYSNIENYKSNYLEIVDNRNNILYNENFSIPNTVIYDIGENANFTESKIIELENVSFNVYLPYYENAYQLIVYNDIEKKEVDRIFLSQFSKTGFDRENFKDINKDEEVGNKTEGIENIEKKELKLLGKELNYKNFIFILLIILVILIIILIYYLKKKERL